MQYHEGGLVFKAMQRLPALSTLAKKYDIARIYWGAGGMRITIPPDLKERLRENQ